MFHVQSQAVADDQNLELNFHEAGELMPRFSTDGASQPMPLLVPEKNHAFQLSEIQNHTAHKSITTN